MTDVKEQQICNKFCFKLCKTASETHSMHEEAFGDNALGQTQTYEWFKRFKKWWMSVNEEECSWWPSTEPWPNMWQKYGTEGIKHKEFVQPGQTLNGKFYCGVLKQMTESIRRKRPDKWRNNSTALHHDNAPARASLVVWKFLASTKMTVILQPPYSLDLNLWLFFSHSQRWNWSSRGDVLAALKRSRPNRRTWWRQWSEMPSSSASDHGNPAGITVSMQKGTTVKGIEVTEISLSG